MTAERISFLSLVDPEADRRTTAHAMATIRRTRPDAWKVRLVFRQSVVGDFWTVRRVEDGRTEATSFETEAEARTWAVENGWEIEDD